MKRMNKLSSQVTSAFENIKGYDGIPVAKSIRAAQVRKIWAGLVEEAILNHTNAVYILKDGEKTVMKVYVDESIYAAELNNRRELLQLLCHTRYGEQIDELQIFISYGLMKKNYPYRVEDQEKEDQRPPVPLSEAELHDVEQACSHIKNEALRAQFKKAMIADLEWKKGNP